MISEEQEVSLATRKTKGAKGGGTIRQRPDRRWEARYTLGIDPGTGKQIQKSVYGKTQREVRQKLTAIWKCQEMCSREPPPNLKSTVIQRSFPKWSAAERRKTAAASDQAACCARTHSRYFTGGSPSGLRV